MRRAHRSRVIIAAATAFAAITGAPAKTAETVSIYTVNYPLAYFAERLTGDAATVAFPAPADRDPAFWKPSIAEIGAYQKADLVVLNGAGYAQWTTKTTLPRRALLDASAGFADDFIATETITHSHGSDGAHSHTGVASHVWLDLSLAERQAEAIAERLKRLQPGAADAIDENLAGLATDLRAIDTDLRELGAAYAQTPLVASHPRYQYFSRRYGFNIRSVEWEPSEPPTDAQWEALDTILAEHPAAIMIWEAAPLAEVEAALRERGVQAVVVETAANRPKTGDFLDVLRRNLDALKMAR